MDTAPTTSLPPSGIDYPPELSRSAFSREPGHGRGLDYTLVLPEFEGPLDLLLHLVRKHELDVFHIPISFITEQYVLALERMHALNMDVAGEYLLMAATLAYIKSRELLPPEAQLDELDPDGEDEEAGDPRESLIRRLLEYQRFKGAAGELALRPVVGRNVWTREVPPEAAAGDILQPAPLAEVPVWELIDLLAGLHGRRQKKLTHEVTVERLSLADRINQLSEQLERAPLLEPVLAFETLLFRLYDLEPTSDFMYQVVLTFLAVLEMARLRLLTVYQASQSVDPNSDTSAPPPALPADSSEPQAMPALIRRRSKVLLDDGSEVIGTIYVGRPGLPRAADPSPTLPGIPS